MQRPVVSCSAKRWASALIAGMVPLVVSITVADEVAPPGGSPDACEELFRLANTMDFDHAWTGTMRLRQMESACEGSENERTYWQIRATMENLLGHHRSALEYFNRTVGSRRTREVLPTDAESRSALAYIVSRAASHRVVMVNERHHVSTERLLTLELLRRLYDHGFRYFAVEALWEGDDQLNHRRYPIRETGGYVSDVVFGELIREALAIGYDIVPYEATSEQWQPTETMSVQQARDYWQAQNLIAATLGQDPEAKVLVHCGYGHLIEAPRPGWTPMAHYFREETGLDPLTIDQTLFAERGAKEMEHPWRIAAEERGLAGDRPVIFVDGEGDPLPVEPADMDIKVMNPSTKYRDGRPAWMTLGGRRTATVAHTPECAEEACIVEAFHPAWDERAVPYDRVEVKSARAAVYIPPRGDVVIRGYRRDGNPAFQRQLVRSPLGGGPECCIWPIALFVHTGSPRSQRMP